MTPIFITDLLYCFLSSSRSVFIRDLLFRKRTTTTNNRFPTTTLGNDDYIKKEASLNLLQDLPIV